MNPAVKIRKVQDRDLMRIFGFYFDLFSESYDGVTGEGLRRLIDIQRESRKSSQGRNWFCC